MSDIRCGLFTTANCATRGAQSWIAYILSEFNEASFPTTVIAVMSPSSRLFGFLGAALGGTLATASTTTSSVSSTPYPTICFCILTIRKVSTVQWGPCDPSIINNTAVSCGFFNVPLDYNDTSVGTAKLALAKVNATLEPRLGTVFFNPGASFPHHTSERPSRSRFRGPG